MNKFAVLCLGLAAMAMTVESSKCWEGCTLLTKYVMTMNGETTDMMKEMPEESKKCAGETVTCSSGTACKSYTMTMTGDMTLGIISGKLDMTSETTMCVPDSVTATTELCTATEDSLKSMLGGTMTNINVECSALKAASVSSATGFGFGAFLVTIVYFLY